MSKLMKLVLALVAAGLLAFPAAAQTPTPSPVPKTHSVPSGKQTFFPTAEAAANAITDALRKDDDKAMAAILGMSWRDFVPGSRDVEDQSRAAYLKAWDESHKLVADGDARQLVEVGTTGFRMPIPIVKEDGGWRFDTAAGQAEMTARLIGRNELTAVQTLLAIVDAQFDYASADPMKTGVPGYARRLLSSAGKKDGLYWDAGPGEPDSPLGPLVAKAQSGDRTGSGYNGYHYRLLYGQGANAPGGAYSYLVGGRMIGGFGVIAWPVTYGQTGVMSFIVNQNGDVYERDLGPETPQRAGTITVYDPDKEWQKADTTPP